MKTKWKPGRKLTPAQVLKRIEAGRPVYHRHKLQTVGWSQSWQVRMIINDARKGYFREAKEIEHAS